MSIEVSSAPQGAKSVSNADSPSKKVGKTSDDSTGFAAVMNSLEATDSSGGETGEDTPQVGPDDTGSDTTTSDAGAAALLAQSSVTVPLMNSDSGAAQSVDLVATAKTVGLKTADLNKTSLRSAAQAADSDTLSKLAASSPMDAAVGASDRVGPNNASSDALTTPVNALLAHRSLMQSQTASAVQSDLKETKASTATPPVVAAADASVSWLAGGMSDLLVRPQGRFGAKSGPGQSGSSGFEGMFGQSMTTASSNRSEAIFEVPSASAVVPDTAIAETVSYWASHGVQTAELKLDGFGDTPVEVSILLNGDTAQIDFRTDQTDLRQVLEGAAAHLKELLSSEGLQLSGVSVGSSGKGSPGQEQRQRPGAQQVTFAKIEAPNSTGSRTVNPTVGRSLDLFV